MKGDDLRKFEAEALATKERLGDRLILFDPENFKAALAIRLLDAVTFARLSGIAVGVLYDVLGRRSRRNADGLVLVNAMTARKIALTLASIKPLVIPEVVDQGPRRLPDEVIKRNAGVRTCPHCGKEL
jgi:hypothetical protein